MPTAEARAKRGEIFTEHRINQIGLAGLSLSFVLLLIAFVFVLNGLRASDRAGSIVAHSYQVKDVISDASRDLERAEAASRGFQVTRQPQRLEIYDRAVRNLRENLDRLDTLTLDNDEQQRRIDELRPLLRAELNELSRTNQLAISGDIDLAIEQLADDDDLRRLTAIRALADAMGEAEDALLQERQEADLRSQSYVRALLIVVGIALLITALGTIWVLRRQLRAVFLSRAQLTVLNANLESAVAERTADLRRANEEIQRFAYIVSHDLRSPLVNVMGFTSELETADRNLASFLDAVEKERPDLVTKEAGYAVREDLPEAIGFIRSSTQKMDRLINAILDLSRQGRRVLAPGPLDMNALIDEIARSLATMAEERDAEILIEPLPELVHDRIAVEQIFTNLLENALKYLRTGVPGRITVRGRTEGKKAVFEVEDNGRGIKDSDHERIFELFRRSGEQDQRGEGIGLANVRALAYRLGGTVEVRSHFGEGSVFTVTLPTEFVEEGTSNA